MATKRDWSVAFAEQAYVDLQTRERVLKEKDLPDCQQLHFLQMSCEKLCKAHVALSHPHPEELTSHAVVAGVLPLIFWMKFAQTFARKLKRKDRVFKQVKHLAREIELLAPAVDDAGYRKDNCEYPWLDGEMVRSPAKWTFANLDLLRQPSGSLLIRLIGSAIDDLRRLS